MSLKGIGMNGGKQKNMAHAQKVGYGIGVAEISAAGLGRPNQWRTHRQFVVRRFFCVLSMVQPLLAFAFRRAMRGAVRLAGSTDRSTNPHGSAFFAFGRALAGNVSFLSVEVVR